MKKIIIYSSVICPYCSMAKTIFKKLNLSYNEILVDGRPNQKKIMTAKSNGGKTVPQIFFDDSCIGGYDELNELYVNGKLKKMLNL